MTYWITRSALRDLKGCLELGLCGVRRRLVLAVERLSSRQGRWSKRKMSWAGAPIPKRGYSMAVLRTEAPTSAPETRGGSEREGGEQRLQVPSATLYTPLLHLQHARNLSLSPQPLRHIPVYTPLTPSE